MAFEIETSEKFASWLKPVTILPVKRRRFLRYPGCRLVLFAAITSFFLLCLLQSSDYFDSKHFLRKTIFEKIRENFRQHSCASSEENSTTAEENDLSPFNVENCPDNNNLLADRNLCIFRHQIFQQAKSRALILETFKKCMLLLNQVTGTANFIYESTLLGFYRHNASLVPWEDSLKVAIFPTARDVTVPAIVSRFSRLAKTHLSGKFAIGFDRKSKQIKFYGIRKENSQRIVGGSSTTYWRWPFVEIQIMNMTRSKHGRIIHFVDPSDSDFTFKAETILPLRRAKFEGVRVHVPNDVQVALERTFNLNVCNSLKYDRRIDKKVKRKFVVTRPCSALMHFVNFTNLSPTISPVVNPKLRSNNRNSTVIAGKEESVCPVGIEHDDPLLCSFLPTLTPDEKASMLNLMKVTIEMLENIKGANWFIYAGTLLGYWRHNRSMIPWDDDGDFALVRKKSKYDEDYFVDQFKTLIRKHPGYDVTYQQGGHKVKVFATMSTNSRRIVHNSTFSWRWPFVDVMLMLTEFEENELEKITETSGSDEEFTYKGGWIYPLHRVEFESMPVNVPNDIPAILSQTYELQTCTAAYYNHRAEEGVADERRISRPCVQLKHLLGYSFTNIFDEYYYYETQLHDDPGQQDNAYQ